MTRSHLALGFGIAVTLFPWPSVAHGAIAITPVGTPQFQVVDAHLYTAAVNLDMFDGFSDVFPKHFPRVVHAPPYDTELADGLAITGYAEKEVYRLEEFIAPGAVHLGFMVVPALDAPIGSAFFDYTEGPIIPNAIMPITLVGDVYLNGALFEEENGAFSNSSPPADGVDGRGHFIFNSWENSSFARPGLTNFVGDYEYRLNVRDQIGNGYDVVASFRVVPEPATLSLVGLGILASSGLARRRRSLSTNR